MDKITKDVLEYSKNILYGLEKHSFHKSFEKNNSARCIEIPWTASKIIENKCTNILDIGFSLASLDYLGLILELNKNFNKRIEVVDIIDPKRLKKRYPEKWLKDIYSIPIYIGDVRNTTLPTNHYDMVTCISVIEHIGYDKSSKKNEGSVFLRSNSLKALDNIVRDSDTNKKVLDKIYNCLKNNGILLLTVPMGKGGPVVLQDSLGFFCLQWEYEKDSWKEITGHPGFSVIEHHYFKLSSDLAWVKVKEVNDLRDQVACFKSHSNGCALAVLQKNST